jgi:hypothetical protein
MQRRTFLQNLGTAVPAGVVAAGATEASGKKASASETSATGNAASKQANEPHVFLFDDGRHAACLYQFEPPITPGDLAYNVDQLVDSGVDTLVYFAGVEGGVVLYDSQVAQTWGDNVTRWTHPVWYRAGRNIQQLIRAGHDPLKVLCNRCNEKGIFFIASNWVNLLGGDRKTYGGQGRKCDFVYDNPQLQVGPESDPRAKAVPPERFSFLHPEVRAYRFRIFEELLSRYQTDGIELNLLNDIPFCKFSQTEQLAPLMTEWIRELRAIAVKAEQQQGRRKRIYARLPSQPAAWKTLGYDVTTWIREKLVDGLMVLPAEMEGAMDQHVDYSSVIKLARQNDCRVLVAFSGLIARQFEQYATQSMIWAAAANGYAQGADGFGLAEHHWTPNGWPWTDEEYATLRLLGHPELLATADKLYRARSAKRGQSRETWLPGGELELPRELIEGQPVGVPLRIADRLDRWHAQGRVDSVRLRVRITNIEPSLNDVRVSLNGRELPASRVELNDLIYRLYNKGAIGPYGYVYEYDLPREHFPKPGKNLVDVTLTKKDGMIDTRFELYDVDLAIRYRKHRNFKTSAAAQSVET